MQYQGNESQWRRWAVVALALISVGFYAGAWVTPMWGFYLYAPQYPDGLVLSIYLNHFGGDVTEIDILNHYIGMGKLAEAAEFERSMAIYGLCGIGFVSVLLAFFPIRRYSIYFAMPAVAFPVVFLLSMFYWMYRFGHELKAGAPMKIAPFTPTMFGEGSIGNFTTLGMPGAGFYLILASAVSVSIMFLLCRRTDRARLKVS